MWSKINQAIDNLIRSDASGIHLDRLEADVWRRIGSKPQWGYSLSLGFDFWDNMQYRLVAVGLSLAIGFCSTLFTADNSFNDRLGLEVFSVKSPYMVSPDLDYRVNRRA